MSYALARAPGSQASAAPAAPMSASQKATQLRKAQQRYRSMVIFAKMLGLTWNVQIIFDPSISTARTDKKTIRLRPCSIGYEEDAILMEGLLDHEAGVHCRQTDFELLSRWAPTVPEITKNLWNICEDVWGERDLYRIKPGCARSINAALEILVKRGLYGHASEDLHPSATLVNSVLGGLRYTKLRQSVLRDFYESNWALAEKHFGLELAGKVWKVAQDVDHVNSTAGAITLAERITGLLRDFLQEPPPPPPPPPAPSSSDQQDDDSDDDSYGEDPDGSQGQNGKSSQADSGDAGDQSDSSSGADQGQPSDDDGDSSKCSGASKSGSSGNAGDNDDAGSAGDQADADQGGNSSNGQGNPPGDSSNDATGSGSDGNSDPDGNGDDQGSDGSGGSQGSPHQTDANQSSNSGSGSSSQPSHGNEPGDNGSRSEARSNGPQAGDSNDGSAASGAPQQSKSVVSPENGSDKGSKSNSQGSSTPRQPSDEGSPDQKPGDEPTGQGDAAPQPAPMTPEEFQNALRAVQATIAARTAESGTGELGDAVSDALGNSKAPAEARALGISVGNQWDLGSAKLAPNPSVDSVISEISRPIAVRLGSKLDSLLEAQTTANTHTKCQGRRIAHGKLVGVVTSAKQRIFKASDDVEELDTVVKIVTDISASMTAAMGQVGTVSDGPKTVTRIGGAAAVTRALGDVLTRFSIPFGISYFGACLTTLKKYDDNWRLKKELYWTALESSTCTDQALIGVIPELAARSESRKLLVLVTDGIPANAQAAALALSEARKLGIDCCVVIVTAAGTADTGLQAFKASLDNFGIPHASASAVDELAQTVFDAVKQAF